MTLIRIFEELRERGYTGGYDTVRRYARRWSKQRGQSVSAAFVPLSFAPGEAYQFDWSHEIVLLNGATVKVKVAHVRLCYSRMLFVHAYPRETQEMVFDAHERAFSFFRGTCRRGMPDFVAGNKIVNRHMGHAAVEDEHPAVTAEPVALLVSAAAHAKSSWLKPKPATNTRALWISPVESSTHSIVSAA